MAKKTISIYIDDSLDKAMENLSMNKSKFIEKQIRKGLRCD